MAGALSMKALSQAIAADTSILEEYFTANRLPMPSFDVDGPQDFRIPTKGPIFEAYERLVDNTRELHILMIGPSKAVRRASHLEVMVVHVLYRLGIAHFIPIHGSVTYEEAAEFAKIDKSVLRRILRYAMSNFLFYEDPDGRVRHSAQSRRLAEDANVHGAVGMITNESFPGSAKVAETLIRNGNTHDPLQCGWALANDAHAPLYEELNQRYPERARPVAEAMGLLALITPVDQLLHNFPWADLGEAATVVDVGGGRGAVGIALAKHFMNLRCIVQDLDLVARSGEEELHQKHRDDSSLLERVSFMSHNFFHQQPVSGADVYYFRYIMHDWPEEKCLQILRALVPAFKVGSRVVINEFAIPKRGTVSEAAYRFQRTIDMNMMVYFNGQERELDEWKDFIEKVHPRLKFIRAYHPKVTDEERLNRAMAIVEAIWTD